MKNNETWEDMRLKNDKKAFIVLASSVKNKVGGRW